MYFHSLTRSLLVVAALTAFGCSSTVDEQVLEAEGAQSAEAASTAFDSIKQALTARVDSTPNSMYEYELDYQFTARSFLVTRKVGEAEVIGRSRIADLGDLRYYTLENDGLDLAQKKFFITGPDSDRTESIEILFSVLEWERRGRDRGSEGAHLLILKGSDGKAELYRKDGGLEWTPTTSKIEITEERITLEYEDESPIGRPEKRILELARNETLDIQLSVEVGDRRVLLGSYAGGQR